MTRVESKRAHDLIEAEAFRRIMSGHVPETLDQFAFELTTWLRNAYPTVSAMPLATIERQIQDIWHRRHEIIRGGGS